MKLCKEENFKKELKDVLDKLQKIIESIRTEQPVSKDSIYSNIIKESDSSEGCLQIEFNFLFSLYEATFEESDTPEFIVNSCFRLLAANKGPINSTIKLSENQSERALKIIDNISKIDYFEFVKIFELIKKIDQ